LIYGGTENQKRTEVNVIGWISTSSIWPLDGINKKVYL
jgi:hypothetical protein